ncbi:MAG: imidazole glycerol phosphate synthase subunit HisH [Hydrotalea sp.]|nr:imidazole glycerol phosphate synthase subunit HisH [Hydrotalea sp.]
MISIIDYGVGNVKAFANIYKRLGIAAEIVSTKEQLNKTDKIILPGVGAFDHAMGKLKSSDLYFTLNELVLEKHTPVLGVCVGMQMMAKSSDEGVSDGLGWIDGTVKLFDVSKIKHVTRLPHMGWNNVKGTVLNPLMENLENSLFYFLHSYYFVCNDKSEIIGESDYAGVFTCAVNHKNIYGVQFHPEKSHEYGIQLLKNFATL